MKLGDMVAATLDSVGITKDRVAAITGSKDCGCKERQAAMNRFGDRVLLRWVRFRHSQPVIRVERFFMYQRLSFLALLGR